MKKEKVFLGFLFILTGIFLIINRMGYFPNINVISLILTVFLVSLIIKSIIHVSFSGILFPIAFLCIIYDKQLGIMDITPWTVLIAALLGSIGLSMIFDKHGSWLHISHKWNDHDFETIDVEDEGNVIFKNSFSGSTKYINTDKFEKADLSCSFGEMKVYFDNATMLNDNAIARISVSFGEMQLYIPKEWRVINNLNLSFAEVNSNNKSEIITNTLTLVGSVSFGELEVIYI